MRIPAHLQQREFDVRCEWGLHGVHALAPISDVVVIVDVLSFTTCVDIDHSSRLDCSASAPLLQDESYVDRNFSP